MSDLKNQSVSTGKGLLIILGVFVVIGFIFASVDTGTQSSETPDISEESTIDPITAKYDRIDTAAMRVLRKRMGSLCEKWDQFKIMERIEKTAGKLNHPAYIVGVNFNCHTSLSGINNHTIYVGWIDNPNTGNYECLSHNRDKNAIINGGSWGYCGELN